MALESFDRLIHEPLPGLIALGAGVVLGLAVGFLATGTGSTTTEHSTVTVVGQLPAVPKGGSSGTQTQQATTPVPAPSAEQRRWQAALQRGVAEAKRLGGTAEAAVWLDGWDAPVTAGDSARRMRMWSLSKPPTAIAVNQRAPKPSPALQDAMLGAITRSENCRQRRVVLGLQSLAGGEAGARQAFADVFHTAGAGGVEVSSSSARADASCTQYLQQSGAGLADPLGPALQLGVSTWTLQDGVRFMHALSGGAYGAAGNRVLDLMSQPKQRSRELGSDNDFSADTAWGAGKAFAGLPLAYKAGWGGVAQGRFLAAQTGIVQSGGRTAAVMAAFHPSTQPPSDDPGKTAAPQALEAMFKAMAGELRAQGG